MASKTICINLASAACASITAILNYWIHSTADPRLQYYHKSRVLGVVSWREDLCARQHTREMLIIIVVYCTRRRILSFLPRMGRTTAAMAAVCRALPNGIPRMKSKITLQQMLYEFSACLDCNCRPANMWHMWRCNFYGRVNGRRYQLGMVAGPIECNAIDDRSWQRFQRTVTAFARRGSHECPSSIMGSSDDFCEKCTSTSRLQACSSFAMRSMETVLYMRLASQRSHIVLFHGK